MDDRLSLLKLNVLSATYLFLPGRWALSRPSFFIMRRLQKSMLRIFMVRDDVAIFLVQESAVVLSNRMSSLGCGGFSVLGLLIASRTTLHDNVTVAHSRLLIVIRSEDLALRCFRVLHNMELVHCAQCKNLRPGQHALHPVIQVSSGTAQLQSIVITFLIGISHRKAASHIAMLEMRLILAHMNFVMVSFSFEFHSVL